MTGSLKKINFVFLGDFWRFWNGGYVLQGVNYFINVCFNEVFCTKLCQFIQDSFAHASLIAMNALIQRKQQSGVVIFSSELFKYI